MPGEFSFRMQSACACDFSSLFNPQMIHRSSAAFSVMGSGRECMHSKWIKIDIEGAIHAMTYFASFPLLSHELPLLHHLIYVLADHAQAAASRHRQPQPWP